MTQFEFDFRRLKRIVSIEDVLSHRGLLGNLRSGGGRLVGPCPIHGGDNPTAFVVDQRRNLWYCFTKCKGGGDVVEFVRRLDGGSHASAAVQLASLAGVKPSLSSSTIHRMSPKTKFRPYGRRLSLDPTHPFLQHKGIRADTASRFEVGAWHGRGMLTGCVGVRLHDLRGKPLGYAGRRLVPGTRGKWVFPRGLPKSELLYGFHRITNHLPKGLVVVEGAWAVLRLSQVGIAACAVLGVHISPEHRSLLSTVGDLVVMFDGDNAGRRAARELERDLGAMRVDLPDGYDPDDLSDEELVARVGELLPL